MASRDKTTSIDQYSVTPLPRSSLPSLGSVRLTGDDERDFVIASDGSHQAREPAEHDTGEHDGHERKTGLDNPLPGSYLEEDGDVVDPVWARFAIVSVQSDDDQTVQREHDWQTQRTTHKTRIRTRH